MKGPLRGLSVRAAAGVLAAVAAAAAVQFDAPSRRAYRTDLSYDGRHAFVRLRWRADFASSPGGFRSAWNHDYPRAEQNLSAT